MSPQLDQFCQFYQALSKDNLQALSNVYSEQVVFCDPVHRLQGLSALQDYFQNLLANVDSCIFAIDHVVEQEGQAYVRWQMAIQHPRLNKGAVINVPGVSHLEYSEKIDYHRDYFDLGAMLYENIPWLGALIRAVKRRLAT